MGHGDRRANRPKNPIGKPAGTPQEDSRLGELWKEQPKLVKSVRGLRVRVGRGYRHATHSSTTHGLRLGAVPRRQSGGSNADGGTFSARASLIRFSTEILRTPRSMPDMYDR